MSRLFGALLVRHVQASGHVGHVTELLLKLLMRRVLVGLLGRRRVGLKLEDGGTEACQVFFSDYMRALKVIKHGVYTMCVCV